MNQVHLAQFVLASALMVFLAGAAIRTALRSTLLRGLGRRDALLLAACAAAALAARLAAQPFPASLQLETALGHEIGHGHRWAAGLSAIQHALYALFPSDVDTVATFHLVVSVLTVPLLFLLVDVYFRDRLAAFAAAAFLALQPISARYGHSDASGVLLTFCVLAGGLFLARWQQRPTRLLLFQGVGWLVLAANIRYEAVVHLAAGGCLVLGAGGWPSRARWRQLLPGIAFGLLFLAYPTGRALLDASGGVFELSPLSYFGPFFLSSHSPLPVAALGAVGLVAATLARFRETVWFFLALVVVSLPALFVRLDCGDLVHRFALPHLAFWAAFAGLGFGAASRWLTRLVGGGRDAGGRRPAPAGPAAAAPEGEPARRLPLAPAAAALALAALAALPHRGFLSKTWTHALEYRFLVAHLGEIPDDCLLVGPDSDWEIRGLRITENLSREVGRRHRWQWIDSPDVLAGRVPACTVYYRASACHGFESLLTPNDPDWMGRERPACARIRDRYVLEPIVETTLPSIGYQCEEHSVVPVPVGLYRLHPRAAAGGAGPAVDDAPPRGDGSEGR